MFSVVLLAAHSIGSFYKSQALKGCCHQMAFFKVVIRCQEQKYKDIFLFFFFFVLMFESFFMTVGKFIFLLFRLLFIFLETSTVPVLYVISVKNVHSLKLF